MEPALDCIDGEEVAPAGTDVFVRLTEAKRAGSMTGQSELELQLAKFVLQGRTYPLVSDVYEQKDDSRGKQTARRTGIGAVAGVASTINSTSSPHEGHRR